MKNLILALVVASIPMLPHSANAAEGVTCHSVNVADDGYILNIAADSKAASLEEESIAGPRHIDDMECEAVPPPAVQGPDMMRATLECRSIRRMGGGYVARLMVGGFAFHMEASLKTYAVTSHGVIEHELQFGNLACPMGRD